jgi:hypothetical protein
MMNPHIPHTVKLVVSDPWDFVSAVGSGPFEAQIVETEGAVTIDKALIKLAEPLDYAGNVIEYLVATPRHTNQTLDAISDGIVHINAQWLDGPPAEWVARTAKWRGGLALIADLSY